MRTFTVAICLTVLVLGAAATSPRSALAQSGPVPSSAGAPDSSPIGKVANVTGTATIQHSAAVVVQANVSDGPIAAKVGDFVYRSDVVQTGADGKISLIFSDGTAFNLSSNARMVLNEFVYDPNSTSNSTLFSLTKGSFTFVAGKVAKTGNMSFDTPVATMGIRGTTPRVEIGEDGTVKFSTLVEEDGQPLMRSGRAPAKAAPASRPHLQPQPATDPLKKPINLNICRGC